MTKKSEKRARYSLDGKVKPFRGGEAEVLPATDRQSGDLVAFKRLLNKTEHSIARLKREVEVQRKIQHPNVMPVLDWSDHFHWYVMPLASGTLGRMPTPISTAQLIEVVDDTIAGLVEAHRYGFIHRDVTPN